MNRDFRAFHRGTLNPVMTKEQQHDLHLGQDIADPKYYADRDLAEIQSQVKHNFNKKTCPQIRMFHPKHLKHVDTHLSNEVVLTDQAVQTKESINLHINKRSHCTPLVGKYLL